MIDKITLSLMLFFNTLTSSIDPSLSDERKSVNQIKKEIKSLERKIEWVEVTDENYASRAVKTKEITDEITKLNGKNGVLNVKRCKRIYSQNIYHNVQSALSIQRPLRTSRFYFRNAEIPHIRNCPIRCYGYGYLCPIDCLDFQVAILTNHRRNIPIGYFRSSRILCEDRGG